MNVNPMAMRELTAHELRSVEGGMIADKISELLRQKNLLRDLERAFTNSSAELSHEPIHQ